MFVGGCMVAGAAVAAVAEDSEAPVLRAGGVSIYPGFALTEKHNDNLLRSDINKVGSSITVFSPSVLLETKTGANAFSLGYDAEIGRYAQSSADNYTDQNLSAAADLSFSTRASLKLSPQYQIGHDERGSTYSILTAVPNTWHNAGIDGLFTYGSADSIGRIVLDLSSYEVRYQNNRAVTTAFDKARDGASGTFYYRVSPKVSAFAQLSGLRIKYLDNVTTLSGNERRILVGAAWKATAQTSGSFKVGQLQKKFDSALRTSFTGTSWEGSVRWSPREFARLDWVTARTSTESTGVGNFILITSNTLDLGYDVSGATTLHLTAANLTEDFSQSGRNDDTVSYGVRADYRLRKWLVLNAEYSNSVKTSTGYVGPSPNYKANVFSVGIHTEF